MLFPAGAYPHPFCCGRGVWGARRRALSPASRFSAVEEGEDERGGEHGKAEAVLRERAAGTPAAEVGGIETLRKLPYAEVRGIEALRKPGHIEAAGAGRRRPGRAYALSAEAEAVAELLDEDA